MYLTALFIEKSTVGEHGLDVLPPISHIQVLSLLNLLLDCGKVHRIYDHTQIILVSLLASEIFRGNRVEESLGLFVIPYVSRNIPEFLNPLSGEGDLGEFIVNT
jgi:hypothetical protein